MSDANQVSQAEGFDINDLMTEREEHNEALIRNAIERIRNELVQKLECRKAITVFVPGPEHIADAVEERMRAAQKPNSLGSWAVRKAASSDGYQFTFTPS